jgi:predicted dehydrogenase
MNSSGSTGTIEVPDAYLPPDRPVASFQGVEGRAEWSFEGGNQYAAMVDAFADAVATGGAGGLPGEDGQAQMAPSTRSSRPLGRPAESVGMPSKATKDRAPPHR